MRLQLSILKEGANIKIIGYFLLILYLIGISPAFHTHHHGYGIVDYEHATDCEKAIYYGKHHESHRHDEHISDQKDDCWICHHIIITHQILVEHSIEIASFIYISRAYPLYYENHFSIIPNHSFNRGPPLL